MKSVEAVSSQDEPDLPKLVSGTLPAYQRLYLSFRDTILSGQLKAGQRLPSSRELAAFYGIARNTVMQAYEQLISEGYLIGRRGAGTFVSANLPEAFLKSSPSPLLKLESGKRIEKADTLTHSGNSLALAPGCPDLELFSKEHWIKLYSRTMRSSVSSLNWYRHDPGGYPPLREAIAAYLNTHRGVVCEPSQIIITGGSQSGIELVARSLVSSGERVAVENPCYRGVPRAFRLNRAEIVGVPVDEQGMIVSRLNRLKRVPKVAVVTSSRQYPLGFSMPVSRRATLLDWAARNRSWILEDDYDSEFRFRGNPLPALQGMDPHMRTLYLGTFSRSMFPDLRIGYLVAPHSLVEDFQEVWESGGMNPPVTIQATLSDFINDGSYLRHIRRMRTLYSKRSEVLKSLLECHLGKWLEVGLADGGMHFVAFLNCKMDTESVAELALEKGIGLFPLSRCAIGTIDRDGFILGFASTAESEMEAAVRTLADLFRAALK